MRYIIVSGLDQSHVNKVTFMKLYWIKAHLSVTSEICGVSLCKSDHHL